MSRVIIIGAGIAGLATAGLLARAGHDVHVVEKNAHVGGRAGNLDAEGFRFDTGPSWYLLPRVFDHFFELMGTSTRAQLDLVPLDPGYRVFAEPVPGALPAETVTVPRGRDRVIELFDSLEPGAGQRLREYLRSAAHTTDMAEKHFLYNPFSRLSTLTHPEILRSLPELTKLLLTSLEDHAAASFKHPVLRQILGYPAVFLGTEPARAPAIYHLMSAMDLDEGVQYPRGGFAAVVESLKKLALDHGARITCQAEAQRILVSEVASGRPRARGVQWRDPSGALHTQSADVVVSGADLHHTETTLVEAPYRTYPQRWWRRRTSGPGGVLVMLGVRGSLEQLPHHGLFFARDWKRNFGDIFGPSPRVPAPASFYVCRPSATDDAVAPPEHENLFVLVPVPADPSLGSGGADGHGDPAVERAADAAIALISEWAGISDLGERIVVRQTKGPQDFLRDFHSWRGGMLGPGHTLGQSAMFRARNASRKVAGLYYAGATTSPGVGVPMCLISAELVVKRILGDHSAGPLPTPLKPHTDAGGRG
ncbi:phytoene desaturase family protein [Nesterenkonia flava]|uniref:Phytoene desaturase family protein n=1 Tax=Nesterenkonia flava TaxID=469799 RepID=A0ABU1FTE1_9MICC|nr:phytoene desaturase family protein [Nesterenkonia flava]MDR5711502.1 phytoene desaturase family protein [Nesterenkonia flava]